MDAPQRHADNTLFTSITKAQENMDSSLKRDGLVNPGGPTESTYTKYVGQGFMKAPSNPVTPAKAGAQSPGTLDAGLRQHDGFSNRLAQRKPAEAGTGSLYAPVPYYPWCGTKLPKSNRHEWEKRVRKAGFDTENPEAEGFPAHLLRNAWWRKDGQ